MRTYERLNAEVVKFEAQDVITASTPVQEEPRCTCDDSCFNGANGSAHGKYSWVTNQWGMPIYPELDEACAITGPHDCK